MNRRSNLSFLIPAMLKHGWILLLGLIALVIYHILPATLRTDLDIARAIQSEYPEVAGVELYFQPHGLGDGDRVIVKRDFWETRVVFDHGSGDCPSGCINHFYWFFLVYPDGTIKLVDTHNGRDRGTLLDDFLHPR